MILESRLGELVPDRPEVLFQAARYALFSSGKRFRPRLCLCVCQSFGAPEAYALDLACALELIHTYSLIHDDLPCMDNDDFRRGKPSLHKAYGEATALLTGDFFLTLAFEVLGAAPILSAEQKLHCIELLAKAAGAQGMIGGQILDMQSTGRPAAETTLLAMHRGKTGALLRAAMQLGAVAAGAPSSSFPILQILGEDMGLAFQYLDDLEDQEDLAKHRPSALALFGKEGVLQKLSSLKQSIEARLKKLPAGGRPVALLLEEVLWKRF